MAIIKSPENIFNPLFSLGIELFVWRNTCMKIIANMPPKEEKTVEVIKTETKNKKELANNTKIVE